MTSVDRDGSGPRAALDGSDADHLDGRRAIDHEVLEQSGEVDDADHVRELAREVISDYAPLLERLAR